MNKSIILVSLLAASQLAQAEPTIEWLKAPQLKSLQLAPNKTLKANQWQQQMVQYNIDLLGQDLKSSVNKGFAAESTSFYMDVTGQDLSKGVDIAVLSESAVIRLSSLNEQTTLESRQLELTQNSTVLSTKIMASGSQLKELGMAVPENTVAMKVSHQPGTLQLKLNTDSSQSSLATDEHFVIHVFEPNSPYKLAMSTSKQLYQVGEALTVQAQLQTENGNIPAQMNGYISQPNGEKVADLTFTADQSGQMVAQLAQLPFASLHNGLWEVHTIAQGTVDDKTLLRDVSSAFAVSVPTAQFNGQIQLSKSEITLGIDNAMDSRYEINGLLMGLDKAGKQQPIALLMTADWLKQGQTSIAFKLPQDLIESSGLIAPFAVKQLNLKNQSLMTPVQEVATGFEFTVQ